MLIIIPPAPHGGSELLRPLESDTCSSSARVSLSNPYYRATTLTEVRGASKHLLRCTRARRYREQKGQKSLSDLAACEAHGRCAAYPVVLCSEHNLSKQHTNTIMLTEMTQHTTLRDDFATCLRLGIAGQSYADVLPALDRAAEDRKAAAQRKSARSPRSRQPINSPRHIVQTVGECRL